MGIGINIGGNTVVIGAGEKPIVTIVTNAARAVEIDDTGMQGATGSGVTEGDKGDINVVNGQWLLDDIDLGTFN